MTAAVVLALAQDVALLLRSGRPHMAVPLAERLPSLVGDAATEIATSAYERGYFAGHAAAVDEMRRALARPAPRPPSSTGPRRHEWLHEQLAHPERRAIARAALRLDDELLDRVAARKLTMSAMMWRRLREALEHRELRK